MTTKHNFTEFFSKLLKNNTVYLLVKKKENSSIVEFISFFEFLNEKDINIETAKMLKGHVLERLLLNDNIKTNKVEIDSIENKDLKKSCMDFIIEGLAQFKSINIKDE